MSTPKKLTPQEAGRLGGLATLRKYGREHFSRIGSEGFKVYKDRYHGGCAERALFALQKAGKLILKSPPTFEGLEKGCTRVCLCDHREVQASRCTTCNGYVIPSF